MVANRKRRSKKTPRKVSARQMRKFLADFPSLVESMDLAQIRTSLEQTYRAPKRLGPRDPTLRYIRADRGRFEVRVPLGESKQPRLSLGLFHDRGSARRALRLFCVLKSHIRDPFAARDEMARQLGRPRPLPRWVRRCCLRCHLDALKRCRCRRQKVQPVHGYIACVRAPGAKVVLGPFAEPARAHQAARRHLSNVLGDRAAAYMPLVSEETNSGF